MSGNKKENNLRAKVTTNNKSLQIDPFNLQTNLIILAILLHCKRIVTYIILPATYILKSLIILKKEYRCSKKKLSS